jgi:hypothetical protein
LSRLPEDASNSGGGGCDHPLIDLHFFSEPGYHFRTLDCAASKISLQGMIRTFSALKKIQIPGSRTDELPAS